MVFATGALIPLEVRHVWHRPSVAAITILVVNCFIVWFLYRILRRDAEKRRHPFVETGNRARRLNLLRLNTETSQFSHCSFHRQANDISKRAIDPFYDLGTNLLGSISACFIQRIYFQPGMLELYYSLGCGIARLRFRRRPPFVLLRAGK